MAELVAKCPRCGTHQITFDLRGQNRVPADETDWQQCWEVFGVCRKCLVGTIFKLRLNNYMVVDEMGRNGPVAPKAVINHLFDMRGYVNIRDTAAASPPEHLPKNIGVAFREGATCLATECWNAAGTMFRLCVDLATRDLLPPEGEAEGPNAKQRRDLGLRLPWLLDNLRLPEDLRDLSTSIKEDGNDGAHRGTLTEVEAKDLLDFTITLLERLYTEPARVQLAKERRDARRVKSVPPQ